MSLLLTVLLQGAPAALPVDFDLAHAAKGDRLLVVSRCDTASSANDIVVCALRHHPDPIVPLDGWVNPEDEPAPDPRVTRETGMAALTPGTACGIFAGQRECNKAEAARYGYGRGRDPVTFFKKLAGKLIDPDAN